MDYSWQDLFSYAQALYKQGNLKAAIQYGFTAIQQQLEDPNSQGSLEGFRLYDFVAGCCLRVKDFELAEKLLVSTNQLKREHLGETHISYGTGLNNLGIAYFEQGRFEEAIPLFESCLKIYALNEKTRSVSYAETQRSLATALEKLTQYDRVLPLLRDSVEIKKQAWGAADDRYILALFALAKTCQLRGELEEAQSYLETITSVNAQKFGKGALQYLDPMQILARVLQEQGAYTKAEALLLEGKSIVEQEQGTHNLDYATLTHNLGEVWNHLGQYGRSEEILEVALSLKETFFGVEHEEYAHTLNNLSIAYIHNGKTKEAESALLQAQAIMKTTLGQEHEDYGHVLSNLGDLYLDTGRYPEAIPIFLETLELDEKLRGPNHPTVALSHSALGLICHYTRQPELAEKFYLNSLAILMEFPHVNLRQLSTVAYRYAFFLDQLKMDIVKDDPEMAAETLKQCRLYYYLGLSKFSDYLSGQLPAQSEREKQALAEMYGDMVNGYALFVAQHHATVPAITQSLYQFFLTRKGILGYSTRHMRRVLSDGGQEELKNDFEAWLEIRKKLADSYEQLEAHADEKAWEAQANELEKRLSQHSHEFANNQALTRTSWQDIRQKLQPHEVAIETLRTTTYNQQAQKFIAKYLFLIILPETHPQSAPVLLTHSHGDELEGTLRERYKSYTYSQAQSDPSFRSLYVDETDPYFSEHAERELFEGYWGTLHRFLASFPAIRKIYFSPDGIYPLINLQVLKNPQTGQWLGDTYEFHLVTSTRDLLNLPPPQPLTSPTSQAVLLGNPNYEQLAPRMENTPEEVAGEALRSLNFTQGTDISPLPATQLEIQEIEELLSAQGWDTQVYEQSTANETELKKVTQPQLLHLATHGYFIPQPRQEERDPSQAPPSFLGKSDSSRGKRRTTSPLLHSGLLLAGASQTLQVPPRERIHSEGIFSAYDAANLNLLGTELVVLSACETAEGEVVHGEGIYGLQRAFLLAGAQSVICSLWRVSDEATRTLMVHFYRFWLGSRDVRKAFQQAQQELRKTHPHPFYWGAFVVVGG